MSFLKDSVVVTGGSYSGKTTVVDVFKSKGYRTFPEAAFIAVEDLNRRMGEKGQIEWRSANRSEFQKRVAEIQLSLEADISEATGLPTFLDRGLHDGLAYCRLFGLDVPETLRLAELENRYSHVFVLDTIVPFDSRASTGRTSTQELSQRIGEMLFNIYVERGHMPQRVPLLSLEDRLTLIMAKIGQLL